jgi:signal transduction histidine kinase
MRIQTKIAVLFASLTGGVLLAMGMFLYYLINQNTFEDFYKRLEIRAIVAAKAALDSNSLNGQAYNDIRRQHLEKLDREQEYILPLHHGAAEKALPEIPRHLFRQAVAEGQSTWRKGSTFYYLLHHSTGAGDYLIVISAYNSLQAEYLGYLRHALAVSFIAASLLAFTIGLGFSKNILRPIRDITARVRNMSANSLHLRLDSRPGSDELAELTATFNNMMDRLETAFESQNNFVSHASHEFNTPLTAIIGEAEYALSRPRSTEQYEEAIRTILTSAERLSSITGSLLQLAQTGLTGKEQTVEPIRMDELVEKARRMTTDIIPGAQVYINHSLAPADIQKVIVTGNRTLLELALTNILLNACKYSSNKPVQLALAATRERIMIVVKDEGIGIPADELKYIFDPFFRARNTDSYKGYGIGLPLTRNIIRIHKGSLDVSSVEGRGTEIRIALPIGKGQVQA